MSATQEEFKAQVALIAQLRAEEAAAASLKKEVTARLEAAEGKMLQMLVAEEMQNYRAPAGLVSLSYWTSVKTPKTPEAKAALYEYLKAKGMYDSMVSVNSATLNSFYKDELAAALEAGQDDVNIPGITEITTEPRLSFKKA